MCLAAWKDHDTDFNYGYGPYKSSLRAMDLFVKLFLLVHVIMMAALGNAWFEGFKIFFVNFFLVLAICFYKISLFNMVGKKAWCPMLIMLSAASGVVYTLNSV